MRFRTELPLPQYPFRIGGDQRLMFLGSCFSEHVSGYLAARRQPVCANPFGILFNPLSIAQALDLLTSAAALSDRHYQQYDGRWISFAHHGRFSHPDRDVFLSQINESLQVGQQFLQTADVLFLTFGTSYYYFHREKELVVANCHRVPAACFDKRRACVTEVCEALAPFFAWRTQHRPDLQVVFTVSPVRHLADGFRENQVSKSILHMAVDQLLSTYPQTHYFPAYEAFNDDLRDYRFYADDLCHPSQQGVDYILNILLKAMFSPAAVAQLEEAERTLKREGHRPLH